MKKLESLSINFKSMLRIPEVDIINHLDDKLKLKELYLCNFFCSLCGTSYFKYPQSDQIFLDFGENESKWTKNGTKAKKFITRNIFKSNVLYIGKNTNTLKNCGNVFFFIDLLINELNILKKEITLKTICLNYIISDYDKYNKIDFLIKLQSMCKLHKINFICDMNAIFDPICNTLSLIKNNSNDI